MNKLPKCLSDYLLRLEIYDFAMRLHEIGMGCRRMSRAIMEVYNRQVSERTINEWISKQHCPLGNAIGFRKCPELGYVVSGWLGDGDKIYRYNNGHRQYILRLRVTDYDFAKEWGRAAAIVTGKPQPYKPFPIKEDYSKKFGYKRRWGVCFSNVLLFQILSVAKENPWTAYELLELYNYPEATLSGFFDAEGWVTNAPSVFAEHTNYDLLLMMQELANKIGIHSKIYKRKKNKCWKQGYILAIYRKDSVVNFYQKVNFKIRRKRMKLAEVLKNSKWI